MFLLVEIEWTAKMFLLNHKFNNNSSLYNINISNIGRNWLSPPWRYICCIDISFLYLKLTWFINGNGSYVCNECVIISFILFVIGSIYKGVKKCKTFSHIGLSIFDVISFISL